MIYQSASRPVVSGVAAILIVGMTEPARQPRAVGAADHARELGDVLVVAALAWLLIGAPYGGEIGLPELADRSQTVTMTLMGFATGVLLLEGLAQWLYVQARQEQLSAFVTTTIGLLMKALSATRLAVGLVAVGALGAAGALGAQIILGA
jgi:hypothetical protein